MKRRALFLTAIVLVCAPDVGLAGCPEDSPHARARISPLALLSPDRQALAWFGAMAIPATRGLSHAGHRSEIFVSGLMVKDDTANRRELILAGDFCAVDWSADSRFLLVKESRSPSLLDEYSADRYWVHDRRQNHSVALPLSSLSQAIERHWQSRGRDIRALGGYHAEAQGWEGARSHRVVFEAYRRFQRIVADHEAPERFLGIWSVEWTGRHPKLLSERLGGFVARRFGKPIEVP